MLQNHVADASILGRRDFLTTALMTGSSAAAASGLGLTLFAPNALAQSEEESCDIIDKLHLARPESTHADVFVRALEFMCPDPPPHPPEALVAERWETARQLYLDAIGQVFPYPLAVGHQLDILDQVIEIEYRPLPPYAEFLARETELCQVLGGCGADIEKIVLKILAAIGLSFDRAQMQTLLSTLGELLGGLFDNLLNALRGLQYRQAWRALWAILSEVIGERFTQALARALGRAAATRFFAALASRLLPWIGWGIFIAAILYEFGKQIF